MKHCGYFFLNLFFLVFVLIGCSSGGDEDDFSINGTEIAMSDIAGNWNATQGIFTKAATGPGMQTDVVAEGGTITLNIQSDGRFTITVTEAGGSPDPSTGLFRFDEELLVVFFDDDPGEWEFFSITHNEPNLSISGGNGSAGFDFDGDGTEEPANVGFEFERI